MADPARLVGDLMRLAEEEVEDFVLHYLVDDARAIPLLLEVLASGSPEAARRASWALVYFGPSSLNVITQSLEKSGAPLRRDILHVIRVIIDGVPENERRALMTANVPRMAPALDDRTVIDETFDGRPEIEYVYRVCDFAYDVIRSLEDPMYDPSEFRESSFEDRNIEINVFRNRFNSA